MTETRAAPERSQGAAENALMRFVGSDRLGPWLAVIAIVLGAPSLFVGLHLDEVVGRFIYSDRPGAPRLFEILDGGYAIANGNVADTHWQIEEGFAPWWTYPKLLIHMARPVSLALHVFDFRTFPDSPWLMHAHNLLWMGLLALVATRMYRGALGVVMGGMAALLFAIDHTHGFVVGYVANRHALVTAVFGILALDQHIRSRTSGTWKNALLGATAYGTALLAGESAIAIAGYLFAFSMFAETGSAAKRALGVVPYLAITVVWRAVYSRAGFGAFGSGLYIDPFRDPLRFLPALLERGPILLLGQFLAPPAELYTIGPPWLARTMLVLAAVFVVAWTVALVPLLRTNRLARFWIAGMLIALVPASATYPHNRQLLFSSFGAMAVVAQLWHAHAVDLKGQVLPAIHKFSGSVGAIVLFAHLVASPVALPVAACSVLAARPLEAGLADVGDDVAGKDAVFMTAPDYFAVKLVQFTRMADGAPLPRKWRAISYGPQAIRVRRPDPRTLIVEYDGGILRTPFMQLYRDARIPMSVGEEVALDGLSITVRAITPDGRAERAEFTFDTALDDPRFVFYAWNGKGFSRYTPPPVGQTNELPAALTPWGVKR